jgi:hypothetical protein
MSTVRFRAVCTTYDWASPEGLASFSFAVGVEETTSTPLRCESHWFWPVMVQGEQWKAHCAWCECVSLRGVERGNISVNCYDLEGRRYGLGVDSNWLWTCMLNRGCDIPSYCVNCWTIKGMIVVAKVCDGKDSLFVCMYAGVIILTDRLGTAFVPLLERNCALDRRMCQFIQMVCWLLVDSFRIEQQVGNDLFGVCVLLEFAIHLVVSWL